jgi:hypothetical protein
MIIGQGSLSWKGGEKTDYEANSVEPVCGDDGHSRLRRESVSSPT